MWSVVLLAALEIKADIVFINRIIGSYVSQLNPLKDLF
jgi:hypothetical protein